MIFNSFGALNQEDDMDIANRDKGRVGFFHLE